MLHASYSLGKSSLCSPTNNTWRSLTHVSRWVSLLGIKIEVIWNATLCNLVDRYQLSFKEKTKGYSNTLVIMYHTVHGFTGSRPYSSYPFQVHKIVAHRWHLFWHVFILLQVSYCFEAIKQNHLPHFHFLHVHCVLHLYGTVHLNLII